MLASCRSVPTTATSRAFEGARRRVYCGRREKRNAGATREVETCGRNRLRDGVFVGVVVGERGLARVEVRPVARERQKRLVRAELPRIEAVDERVKG